MKTLKKLAHLCLRLWLAVFNRFRAGPIRLDRPSLIVANHASHIDIAAIFSALPLDEIPRLRVAAARDAIFTQPGPIVCLIRFLFNAFPFERKEKSTESLDRCAEYLRRGYHVVIFPEGRRSQDGSFLGFTPGFASVAYKTGAPVVPVRIEGSARALKRGSLVPLSYRLILKAGVPIEADMSVPWEDRQRAYQELVRKTEEAVAA